MIRRLLVPAFLAYAAVLFVATHWPNLKIESDVIERPDLLIHLGAFGLWAFLLHLTGLLGPAGSARAALKTWGVGALYAAVDEASQAIPILGRTAVWDDYLANLAGLALGAGAACLAARILPRGLISAEPAPDEPRAEGPARDT